MADEMTQEDWEAAYRAISTRQARDQHRSARTIRDLRQKVSRLETELVAERQQVANLHGVNGKLARAEQQLEASGRQVNANAEEIRRLNGILRGGQRAAIESAIEVLQAQAERYKVPAAVISAAEPATPQPDLRSPDADVPLETGPRPIFGCDRNNGAEHNWKPQRYSGGDPGVPMYREACACGAVWAAGQVIYQ